MENERNLERRCRNALKREGYYLQKSRKRKHFNADDEGGYMIVELWNNCIEAGERFDMSLEDVMIFCGGELEKQTKKSRDERLKRIFG